MVQMQFTDRSLYEISIFSCLLQMDSVEKGFQGPTILPYPLIKENFAVFYLTLYGNFASKGLISGLTNKRKVFIPE